MRVLFLIWLKWTPPPSCCSDTTGFQNRKHGCRCWAYVHSYRTNITELKVPKGPTYYLLYCVRRIRQNVTITFKVQTKKSNSRNFRLGSSENFLFSGGQLSACHDYLAVNDILRWSWWSDLLSLLWDCLLRNQPPACCCLSTTGWIVVVIITS